MTDATTNDSRFSWRTGAVVGIVAVAVLIGMMALASGNPDPKPGPDKPTTPTMTRLNFAVWGSKAEIAAYQSVVDDYNASSKDTNVAVTSWPTAAAMLIDVRSGKAKPDLYLLPRSELAETIAEKRNRPLGDLVIEREIPVGDDFSREAVGAFSVEDDLQCMPYTTSPMVMYVNTKLVDFKAMAEEGLSTPKEDFSGWNFAQFQAAAEFASRPGKRASGVYIEPTLRGLAPFIYSGGGKLFDDDTTPRSLALGDDDSTSAMRRTLELLRNAQLTLSSKQLAQRPAIDWFKRGRLGMIAGFRGLTPELRAVTGLEFDVMPMPSLGKNQTVGELNGVCLASGHPRRAEASANFLSYLVSDEAVARVAETGYIQPTKLTVAFSSAFLQPDQAPEHAMVFNNAVRAIVLPPLMQDGAALQSLITPDIKALLTTPVLADELQELLRAIDEKSRTLLDPDYEPEEESSDDPSASGSPSVPEVSPGPSESATDDRKRD